VQEEIAGRKIPVIIRAAGEGSNWVLQAETQDLVLSNGDWRIFPRSFRSDVDAIWYHEHLPEMGSVPTRGELARLEARTLEIRGRDGEKRTFFVCAPDYLCPEETAGIMEFSQDGRTFHPLPQPSFETFQRYRPLRIRDGYRREVAQIRQEIGPFQLVGDRVWFGVTYYDGEGITGVGGLGNFHIPTRKFRVHYYHEIADWSASAILVERDAIWLGLLRRPEGALRPGGLVRFDRKTGTFAKFNIPAVINTIARAGDGAYFGTSAGIFALVGGEVLQWEFEPDESGKYKFKLER
jgi:hypothetical protein